MATGVKHIPSLNYIHGSAEIAAGYSSAMSLRGPVVEVVSALEAVAVLALLLWLQVASCPAVARFYALLLAIPLFFSFKHGFVRQDAHVINFFCFVALALALVSLRVNLDKVSALRVAMLVVVFVIIWQDNVGRDLGWQIVTQPSGIEAANMLWGVMRPGLGQRLDSSATTFPSAALIEPELVNLIGDSPVASLSNNFASMEASHMRLQFYPVVQRYSAYTPYLDTLNAAWIRDKGPRFLMFDGDSIDGRDPWAATPAMWLEIYRWYGSRLLGSRNLLLERRTRPRFAAFETIRRFPMALSGKLSFPVSSGPLFWTMKCGYSIRGRLRNLLFRVPGVFMYVHESGGITRSARIIPAVLISPVLGNYLPGGLSQFYALFGPGNEPGYSVDQVVFGGSGTSSYASTCEVELLRPAQ